MMPDECVNPRLDTGLQGRYLPYPPDNPPVFPENFRLNELGQHFKLARAFGTTQVLRLLVTHHLSFEFHRKRATLQLLFLNDFQCAMLLICFHDFSFVK